MRSSVIEFVWSERDFVSGTAIGKRKPVGEKREQGIIAAGSEALARV